MQLWVFDSILFSGRRIFSSSYKYVEFEEFEMEGVQWLQWLQTANDWSKAVETELFCHFASQYHHLKVYLSQIVFVNWIKSNCDRVVLLRNTIISLLAPASATTPPPDAWSAWTPGRNCNSCSFSGWFLFQASLKLATNIRTIKI